MGKGVGALRVAVIGGGVLGTSVGVELARGGAQVTLLTEGDLASGASGRSLSWLNSSAVYSPAYHRLRIAGLERYRALAAQGAKTRDAVGACVHLDGGLRWAATAEAEALREVHEHQRTVGYPTAWLSADEVADRVPGVDPAAVPDEGALFNPGEGWVDLPALVRGLAAQLRSLGAQVVGGAGPAELVLRGESVGGVRTATGAVVEADAAVLATGADVPRVLRGLGVPVPDATAPALLVRTAPVDSPLRAVLNTPRVSLRPAPGGTLVMDAGWSEREVTQRPDGTFGVREETVQGLLAEASSVLAGSPRLTAQSWGAGLKPVPGDGEPVLGPVPGVAGCFVAFTHSGATLGPVVGELLARELLTGHPCPLLERFRVDRFVDAVPVRSGD